MAQTTLPPHLDAPVIERILSFVPPTELAQFATVCRQWCDFIRHSRPLWSQHLDKSMDVLQAGLQPAPTGSAAADPLLQGTSYLRLYLAMYARNLLRNPSFSAASNWSASLLPSRRPWVIQEGSHSGLFESPPQGIMPPTLDYDGHSYPPLPMPYPCHSGSLTKALQRLVEPAQLQGAPGCLATTADWAEVMQVVDLESELVSRGLSVPEAHALLDSGLTLGLSLYVASHYSQPGTFAVGLMLDNGQGPVGTQSFLARRSSCHFWSGRNYLSAGCGWKRFAHAVTCPPGFRRAIVLLRGRQASPGDGTATARGVKFASPELRFVAAQHLTAFNVNSDHPKWKKRAHSSSGSGQPLATSAALPAGTPAVAVA